MSKRVIEVSGLQKKYRLGVIGGATLSDDLKVWWARINGRPNPLLPIGAQDDSARVGDDFYALRDVSFNVDQGEILGIIGKNGAGKSTLLKLLSRITTPTEGTIKIKGRSSSLLEVGTGFHPELTGKENIFLNGAILGMRRTEIEAKLDEIVEFSGIKHHIDTPVKRYSSGMKVRLGFAVAAHLEPEVLIIDEVLAVGDADFQRKCIGKMKDVAGSGRTILFVSHNMVSVQSLCTRTIWLNDGKVLMNGDTDEVVRKYLSTYSEGQDAYHWPAGEEPGTDRIRLNGVEVVRGEKERPLTWRMPFQIRIHFTNVDIEDGDLNMGIHLYNGEDILVFASNLREREDSGRIVRTGPHTASCHVPADLLNTGDYRVTVNFFRNGKLHFRREDCISFEVHEVERTGNWFGRKKGVVRPLMEWSIAEA